MQKCMFMLDRKCLIIHLGSMITISKIINRVKLGNVGAQSQMRMKNTNITEHLFVINCMKM